MQQTCSRCGGLLVPGASVCNQCGTPVTSNVSPQQGSGPSAWQTNQAPQPETHPGTGLISAEPVPYAAQHSQVAAPPAAPSGPGSFGQTPSRPITKPTSSGLQPSRQKRSPVLLITLVALVVALGVLLGASGYVLLKNNKNTSQTTPTPTPTPSGISSLYQASLTKDPGNWQCTTATTCSFKKDGYHITGIKKGFISDSLLTKQVFGDTVIEVKGMIAQGDSQNAGIGIEFRVPQDLEAAGYGFIVYDDGTYDVQKWDAQGNSSDLVGTTPTSIIPQGLNQLNDLKIVIKGTQFTFYDNGQQVATASDATYTSGYIGLAAAEQGTEAIFSELIITKP